MEKIRLETVVFSLTYTIALIGFLSVFSYVNILFSAFYAVTFLLAIYLDYIKKHPIPRILLNILSVVISGILLFKVSLSDPITPVIEVLLLLSGVKLLEKKKFRDFMQIYLISMFLLAGSALLNIGLSFLFYFAGLFFLMVLATVFLTYYNEKPDMVLEKKVFINLLLRVSLIPVISIPFTIFIFLTLPRTDYPLFDFLNREKGSSTGFTDSITLGDVSEIQEDSSVAFRAKMEKIDSEKLYWRGATLNFFNGKKWIWKKTKTEEVIKGKKIVYETIIKEPSVNGYLFGLNIPVEIKGINSSKKEGYIFINKKPEFKRISYRVVSYIDGYIEEKNGINGIYLQLPEKIKTDNELLTLAKRLKGKDDIETVNNILKFFNTEFRYSLKGLPEENPLKDFLFKKKQGNCEFFASAAAVLLRLNGIPCRLVVGYKGGVYNDLAKYYIVSKKNAHVWLEAFVNNRWITIDPTPVLPSMAEENSFSLSVLADTINYYWISFVINFDLKKQVSMVKQLKTSIQRPKLNIDKVYIVIFVINVIIFFSGVFYFLYKKYEIYFYIKKFIKKIEKYGYTKGNKEGLKEFVDKIQNAKIKEFALEFVNEIGEVVYGGKKLDNKKRKKLRLLMKKL